MRNLGIGGFIPAVALVFGASVIGSGCAGPTNSAALQQAQATYQNAEADPAVQKYASVDLVKAKEALQQAQAASQEGEDKKKVDHLAYLAQQRASVAQAKGQAGANAAEIEELGKQRPEILLQAEKQKSAVLLEQLQAKQTDRGLVITLGDILFDVGQSTLKPGAQTQLMRLADYLKEHPDAHVQIEGHTDSTGSSSTNAALSQDRALSVEEALVAGGVDPSRITTRGLGESFPVASNSTAAGRQQNRRVDVIIR